MLEVFIAPRYVLYRDARDPRLGFGRTKYCKHSRTGNRDCNNYRYLAFAFYTCTGGEPRGQVSYIDVTLLLVSLLKRNTLRSG